MASRTSTMAFELTAAQVTHAIAASRHCASVGVVLPATRHCDVSANGLSRSCNSTEPSTPRNDQPSPNGARARMTRRFFLVRSFSSAPDSNSGATTTSVNVSSSASAVASVIARFSPTIPPNALNGSQSCARVYADSMSSATAKPHGFACLMTTAAGAENWFTNDQAASASSTLRYDNSLPASCSASLHQLRCPTMRYRAPR